MTNSELINAYLDNELSDADRLSFEQRLGADPALKKELAMHEDIIEGIRSARRIELKQRLNNVDAGGNMGWSAAKVITTVAVVAAVAVAIYFLYPSENTTAPIDTDSVAVNENTQEPEIIEEVVPEVKEESTDSAEPVKEEGASEIKNEEAKPAAQKETIESQPENKRPVIAPSFENADATRTEVTAPDGAILGEVVTEASSLDVEVLRNEDDFDFHYGFDNNTLKLYGNFDEDLYEILEFNSNKGKRWFLSYQGKFYSLDSSATQVMPLTEITDNKLLEVLKNVR